MNKSVFFALLLTTSSFAYGQNSGTVVSGSKTYSTSYKSNNGVSKQEIEYDGRNRIQRHGHGCDVHFTRRFPETDKENFWYEAHGVAGREIQRCD